MVRTSPVAVALACCAVTFGARSVAAQDVAASARAALTAASEAAKRRSWLEMVQNSRRAVSLAEATGDRALLAQAWTSLADGYVQTNDWAAALDAAERAFELTPDPDDRARARYHQLRGRALMEIHERDAAEASYLEARRAALAAGDDRLLVGLANELGLLYWRFDRDRTKALAHYEEGLRIARRLRLDQALGVLLNNSGNIFRYPETYPEAERRYTEGLEAMARTGVRDPFLLKNLAIVYRETGRRAAAERVLLEAVEVADRTGVGRIRWQARMELGTLYAWSDPARADRFYDECLDVLEGLTSNVLLEDFRAGALAGAITIYDDPYDLYIDFLLRQGRPEEAFLVAERARARAFLDTLSLAREQIAATVPPGYVRAEAGVLRRISDRQAALRNETDPGRRRALGVEIEREEDRLASLRLRLAQDHPALAHARYPHLWSVREIRTRLLQSDQALVMYFLSARASTAWIVRRDGLDVVRLASRDAVTRAVRVYLERLSTPDAEYRQAAANLSRLVAPDLASRTGPATRLVIVPHGILHYVPFEALTDQHGRFLVESFAISYAPSASSLAFVRSREREIDPRAATVVAVGGPLAPPRGSAAERGAPIERLGSLKPLPFSDAEVRAVTRLYGRRGRGLAGARATEPALADAGLAQAAIVHFATHGIIDENRPDRSGLALTPVEGSDGLLQVREIFRLQLRAALVTLSACQTALGKEVTGEGVIGLVRAFLYAGANAVMASLWNVSDESTADFMEHFYRAVRAGRPLDEAARAAKLAFIGRGDRLSHPYYWAAFVVSGDAHVRVPLDSSAARAVRWAAGVLLLAGLAAGLVLVRGRRAARRSAAAPMPPVR